ncbi:MAG: Hpt domain-containing protein [Oscillibacter sp.]|jgi:HPt (histidine-containing phosphotransfer) domain-containing protein|nr:Hpt domain-containing protein [Oscillibacter sp.]MCI8689698.1 Hpt domain-containing protein [Oscillibacter sp.]MCI8849647.1 Hpt domain-containing protein [Oscillibacter sp.]MCI9376073.1 Hpt domain-containing protein [Oscillibacter sp.]MCI9481665.1 Hpt domain-containing protein [Oscillibacter sp.]
MTLKECYAAMGSNYDEVIGRLRSERLVQKFVLKFADDGSFDLLQRSLAEQNYSEAFRAAHTIKGVCQNLSLTKLGASSSALAETLRGGVWSEEAAALVEETTKDYQDTISAIRAFQEAQGG